MRKENTNTTLEHKEWNPKIDSGVLILLSNSYLGALVACWANPEDYHLEVLHVRAECSAADSGGQASTLTVTVGNYIIHPAALAEMVGNRTEAVKNFCGAHRAESMQVKVLPL